MVRGLGNNAKKGRVSLKEGWGKGEGDANWKNISRRMWPKKGNQILSEVCDLR